MHDVLCTVREEIALELWRILFVITPDTISYLRLKNMRLYIAVSDFFYLFLLISYKFWCHKNLFFKLIEAYTFRHC